MRYTASTLRGCLLESLDGLRPDHEAAAREAAVVDDADRDSDQPGLPRPWAVLEDFLHGRQVGRLTGRKVRVVSVNDPRLQAELDREPLLDSTEGRAARGRRAPRLDQAAVRLSTLFGRDLTQACSLAICGPSPAPGRHPLPQPA